MKERLIVIGNGMATGRVLETLTESAPGRYDVTVFGAEPRGNYNRILLSPVLSGEKSFAEIVTHPANWYAEHGFRFHAGRRVTAIDRDERTVACADGLVASYDRLVIANGSLPIRLAIPGRDLPGVVTYRDLDDVEAMLAASRHGGRAVVIGGGLLGLEAAAGLAAQGMAVTVLHLAPTLMERQLDQAAGFLLQQEMERRDIRIVTRANTHEITGVDHVTGVRLDDGRSFPADLVVMAIGIRPNTELARDAAIEVNRGIVVDDGMATSDPAILAVGECVEHRGICHGLVAPIFEMARVVGLRLAGEPAAYVPAQVSTKLKVTGVDLFSAGDFSDASDRQEILLRDAARNIYRRVIVEDDRVVGAVLYGETGDGSWYLDLIRNRTSVAAMRDTLIYGRVAALNGPADPLAAVASLPDDAEICGCNGVCKGRIVDTVRAQHLSSLEDVRAHTKASASCGSCTGLVEQLLSATLGDAFQAKKTQPMCGCTDLGHGDVRRLIVARELKSIPAVMQALDWRSSGGCAKCRPAINYYLIATWPGEAEDDSQSRFINERVHANIQKDGTYSVVPRMWGGLTNAAELRAIADVVDKFAIPSVKVTGGQRIDLLGVDKEDLPAVWADLNRAGLVSGHAYAKGLRTVKTCVGSEWCRFGTQDSTGLGVKLEKALWGSWTPAKVKLGVSGCPRNCAEATCKDFGVVCVESGYDLHLGGAAGLEVKQTELLCHVATEAEAIEFAMATIQLYREQGYYLERMHKWAKRVGMDTIRAQIVDDAPRRAALVARFQHSQTVFQRDPWAERVAGHDAHEFRPLATLPYLEAAE
ncbi:MAG: nitrite reductase large subunit NirB [Bauldia sp.]|nr:nitrite reductase large subunit NirB [Bauldia sp.]